ncbi:MAG TPA: cell division protein FtsL [Gammaproteobacteria bacterium]|nr:cell division protein FtsL [Gammaproteobacteria bacterium]
MNIQLVVMGAFLLVLVSATGVIYSKHESRKLFVQLQALQKEQDQMDIEWGRMQLEQSTWATHGRIERLARKKLDMQIPSVDKVVIIRP